MNIQEENFQKEYEEFLEEKNNVSPSSSTSQRTLNFVKQDLCPDHFLIMIKLVLLQTFTGALTLSFCPQFNFSLTNNHELFHFFHKVFGAEICMALCGGIFMGSTFFVAAYVLNEGEILAIQKSRFLHILLLSALALAGFMLLGAEIYLSLLPYWILGAVGFGAAFLSFNFKIKQSLV